jgi:acetate kinase
MNLLVLNCGSATLKFDLFEAGSGLEAEPALRRLASGQVERIGASATLKAGLAGDHSEARPVEAPDHRAAVRAALAWLNAAQASGSPAQGSAGLHNVSPRPGIAAVGHRVVHGGSRFVAPAVIDRGALARLEALSELAPLHNPAAVAGIRAAREALGAAVPMVAVFDTAFHAALPPRASHYALPDDLVERHGIRRFGFHGIAHAAMLRQYAVMAGRPAASARLVTFHLGNGCSAAAIRDGRSIDTSMGFTPLEGLVMGTRSGDLDPGIIGFLAQRERVGAAEVEQWLNARSGLLGLSGLSGDMRDLLDAEAENERAALALDVFCYRARKYLGAYLAALEGAEAVVFGGGIGEHAPAIRARICAGMEWCGLRLDPARNEALVGGSGCISVEEVGMGAYVVSVDEAVLIAEETLRGIVTLW